MKYHHEKVEEKWQQYWAQNQTFVASNNSDKPKYYVLDMFPYPSGAGLHVGHPLGYIASDIVARYKRHKGFNVLHPQGYDSFGLPAEQYAIQTGQHPEKTTRENIARYREQLDRIGFSFDWSREVRTSNADYYKHTQWIFIQLFNSWYNKKTDQAEDISTLITIFEMAGNATVQAVCDDSIEIFFPSDWSFYSDEKKQQILLKYRLTYLAETEVNWCAALGTVLANDEIVNGVSERGGHPVIRKKMTQWSMRISAYAERLLQGLDTIDWSESIKESQRNWIGKSVGSSVKFNVIPCAVEGEGAKTSIKSNPKYLTGDASIAKNLLIYAKEMRKEPTLSEAILWDNLRREKLDVRFRRQHLIGKYIVDFVCLEKRLIVEVDGEYHNTKEQIELDNERTLELEQKHNFKVIRFSNDEVNKQISEVLTKIESELKSIESFPASAPSSLGKVGEGIFIEVFTTRPDTIFGVTFMTLAPEHELVSQITTPEQKAAVDSYVEATAKRSERERMADVKTISGVFTGAFAEHPFTKQPIPVWIGDYVLAGYGTGAVMAVPCGDERDYAFANFFKGQLGMPEIKNIFRLISPPLEGLGEEKAFSSKEGFELVNSDFLNGLGYNDGTKKVIEELEKIHQGKGKTNYRLRDAVFSRQRYWGEPFPVYYVNGLPQMIDAKHLPIVLPEVANYLPTEDGQPPLGNATNWAWDSVNNKVVSNELISPPSEGSGEETVFPLELNTMPGWAGSSWYWMRYMDAHNSTEFASQEAIKYWENVDLYIGGSEHATGHLLYSRFWNKFLKDRGYAPTEEPFKKLINQGMILGMSALVYRVGILFHLKSEIVEVKNQGINHTKYGPIYVKYIDDIFLSKNFENNFKSWNPNDKYQIQIIENFKTKLKEENIDYDNDIELVIGYPYQIAQSHVDVNLINSSDELDIESFKKHPMYNSLFVEPKEAIFLTEDNGKYIVGREVEKMSKSKYNVVSPDDICNDYGADTLRLYEMFLGPLEQSKPWNTAGITGVSGFLKKLWRLYFEAPSNSPEGGEQNTFCVTDEVPTAEMYKSLHKTIKKVTEDIENFSFNTSVSQFMICVNELATMKCNSRKILEPLTILVSPYAPHIAEELWNQLGNEGSISTVDFPICEAKYLVESEKEYPVSFNGKMRFTLKLPLDLTKEQIQEIVLADERTIVQLAGTTPKNIIIVPGKIINLVG